MLLCLYVYGSQSPHQKLESGGQGFLHRNCSFKTTCFAKSGGGLVLFVCHIIGKGICKYRKLALYQIGILALHRG